MNSRFRSASGDILFSLVSFEFTTAGGNLLSSKENEVSRSDPLQPGGFRCCGASQTSNGA